MKKLICNTKDYPELHALFEGILERSRIAKERVEFMEKQMHKLHEEFTKDRKAHWQKIESFLKEKDLLGDYNKNTQHLDFDKDNNLLFKQDDSDREDHNPLKFLGALIKRD